MSVSDGPFPIIKVVQIMLRTRQQAYKDDVQIYSKKKKKKKQILKYAKLIKVIKGYDMIKIKEKTNIQIQHHPVIIKLVKLPFIQKA